MQLSPFRRSLFIASFFLLFIGAQLFFAQSAVVLAPLSQLDAGTGVGGYTGDNGPATSAELNTPFGVAVDSHENIYIADMNNSVIRKVSPAGTITTVAGTGTAGYSGDGDAATTAKLNYPHGVTVDTAGNIYIADTNNNRIRKVTVATGIISTIAGTGGSGYSGNGVIGTSAELKTPNGIGIDIAGNIYVADYGNQVVREINATTLYITTIAGTPSSAGFSGDGYAATGAQLNDPTSVAIDTAGNYYIADHGNQRIRKVNTSGTISTYAGNGTGGFAGDGEYPATSAELNNPTGVAIDGAGNLYIGDSANNRIRVVFASGTITTWAGNGTVGASGDGGQALSAEYNTPRGVAVDLQGNVFIADQSNNKVREALGNTSFATTNVGSSASSQNVYLEVTESLILKSVSIPESQGSHQEYSLGTITGCTVNNSTSTTAWTICKVPVTFSPAYAGARQLPLTVTDSNNNLYIFALKGTGTGPQDALSPGVINTVAGDGNSGDTGNGGPATSATLHLPESTVSDAMGDFFIADKSNNVIREVTASNQYISIVAGNGTAGFAGDGDAATSAELNVPLGTVVDGAGNIYIADTGNNRVRLVTAETGKISTYAGNGTAGYTGDGELATAAELNSPDAVTLDNMGNLYIADAGNNRVRMVNPIGVISTVAGNGTGGYSGDGGPATAAELNTPQSVAVDPSGDIFIADSSNNVIREVSAATGFISTAAGNDGVGGGYSGDGGAAIAAEMSGPKYIALDAANSLYIADTNNNVIREVDGLGDIHTIAGTGIVSYTGDAGPANAATFNTPTGISLDSAGNLYISDHKNYRIRMVSAASAQLAFGPYPITGTSLPADAEVRNTGNATLTVEEIGIGGSNSGVFATASVSNECSSGTEVTIGTSCNIGVTFTPAAETTYAPTSNTLTVTDNSANTVSPHYATQTAGLGGTGTADVVTQYVITGPATDSVGTSYTYTLLGEDANGNPDPTLSGSITVQTTNPALGTSNQAVTVSAGKGTFSLNPSSVGTYSLQATGTPGISDVAFPLSAVAGNVGTCPAVMDFNPIAADNDQNLGNIQGANLIYYWSELEPAKGTIDWTPVENDLTTWAGKTVAIRISTAGWTSWDAPYSGEGTPNWVFATDGSQYFTEPTDNSIIPIYWDTNYLADLKTFIQAFAAKYDGNPNIAYIQMGIGDGGEAMVDTETSNNNRCTDWSSVAADYSNHSSPEYYTDSTWWSTVKTIVGYYQTYFTHTPLAMLMDNGFICNSMNEGTLETFDLAQTPQIILQDDGYGATSSYDQPWLGAVHTSEQLNSAISNGQSIQTEVENAWGNGAGSGTGGSPNVQSRWLLIYSADLATTGTYYSTNMTAISNLNTACGR